MKRRRELIIANVLGLAVLLVALLIGWRDAAAFGLGVLVVLDLIVWVRGRSAPSSHDSDNRDDTPDQGTGV